jgi:hypothetical protein
MNRRTDEQRRAQRRVLIAIGVVAVWFSRVSCFDGRRNPDHR